MGKYELKDNLRLYRLRTGLSVTQAATEAGINRSYLYDLEAGRSKNPSIAVLRALSGVYGLTVAEMIGDDEPAPTWESYNLRFGAE